MTAARKEADFRSRSLSLLFVRFVPSKFSTLQVHVTGVDHIPLHVFREVHLLSFSFQEKFGHATRCAS